MASQNWLLLDARRPSQALHVDKDAIMQRVQINARDLRTLDPNLSYPSTIFGRENAIVLNLEHIKAIITSEQVYLQDSSDENIVPVVEELRRRLRVGNEARQGDGKESSSAQDKGDTGAEEESPFEFRALEVALEAICSFLAARTSELEISAYSALDHLTSKINGPNLDRVRNLKIAVTRLTTRVQKVNDELEQLLNDDDDMADFYLSRKLPSASSLVSSSCEPNLYHTSPPISGASLVTVCGDEKDVEELEMLLEAYLMEIDSTLNKLTRLREYIDATDDYINIEQDNHRNQLIKLELVISSVSVCISVYSLVAGIFGMNIPYKWNDGHGYMFKYVVVFTGILCAVLLVIIMSYARYKRLFG